MSNFVENINGNSAKESDIDLFMMLRQLWGNKWLILVMMLLSLAIGLYYVSREVPQYQVEALLQIQSDHQPGAAMFGGLAAQFNFANSQSTRESTQIALIKSRYVLEPVIKSLGLDIRISLKQSFLKRIFFTSVVKIRVDRFDVPLQMVNHPFTLVFDKNNSFLLYDALHKVVLRGKPGKLAKSSDNLVRLKISAANVKSGAVFSLSKISDEEVVSSLQRRLQVNDFGPNRSQLTGVLSLTLIDTNPALAVSTLNAIGKTIQEKDIQKNSMEASKTLEFLYQQLPILRNDLAQSELKLNRYRAKSGKIDIKLQSEYLLKHLTEIDKQLWEVELAKIDMLHKYTVKHPYIKAINTKISAFRADKMRLENLLKTLPASDQISVNLTRDVKVKNDIYMTLLRKIQELQMIKAGIVSDVRILSLAKLPNKPLPSKPVFVCLFALVVGFILSVMIIFSRRLFSQQVIDPLWGERHFDLVNLSIIPYSKEQASDTSNTLKNSGSLLVLLAHKNPRNLAIEALRSLRTTLQIRLSGIENNIVAIMGISPSVGKTFISANLSYLLSIANKRVLVIDTDMRRGTLHKYFNLSVSPGLSEMLQQHIPMEEVIRSSSHSNLMVLTRGTYPDAPSELLASQFFREFLNKVSKEFDIVIIDTPPVLLVTDSVLIGVHTGTNYLVMGANAHRPIDIEMSIKRLSNAGISLHGSIFNFHSANAEHKGYGYGYGHGYGYGYGAYYSDKEDIKK